MNERLNKEMIIFKILILEILILKFWKVLKNVKCVNNRLGRFQC